MSALLKKVLLACPLLFGSLYGVEDEVRILPIPTHEDEVRIQPISTFEDEQDDDEIDAQWEGPVSGPIEDVTSEFVDDFPKEREEGPYDREEDLSIDD